MSDTHAFGFLTLELVEKRANQHGASRSDRMTERACGTTDSQLEDPMSSPKIG
jgi:hypothetical protein